MTKQVTLKDIANELNLSLGTVSRAIHGKHDINPETKKRILDKVQELNYQPNKYARSLSLKNKKRIAVIMPYTSHFWYRVKSGLDYAIQELSYYGLDIKFIGLEKSEKRKINDIVNTLSEDSLDGLIIVPTGLHEVSECLKQSKLDNSRLVFLNEDLPEIPRRFYIGPDNVLVGKLAGELTSKFTQGKGKCLILTCHNEKTNQMLLECEKRISGFQQVINEEYPQIRTKVVSYAIYSQDAYGAAFKALKQDETITCIYSADGYVDEAAAALKDSHREGIPLVGHEMSPKVNRYLQEGVVSAAICQNPYLQGYYALKYLVEYLVEDKKTKDNNIYVDFKIFTKYNTFKE